MKLTGLISELSEDTCHREEIISVLRNFVKTYRGKNSRKHQREFSCDEIIEGAAAVLNTALVYSGEELESLRLMQDFFVRVYENGYNILAWEKLYETNRSAALKRKKHRTILSFPQLEILRTHLEHLCDDREVNQASFLGTSRCRGVVGRSAEAADMDYHGTVYY